MCQEVSSSAAAVDRHGGTLAGFSASRIFCSQGYLERGSHGHECRVPRVRCKQLNFLVRGSSVNKSSFSLGCLDACRVQKFESREREVFRTIRA